ncbi:hypothetical protein [Streptomyces sp. JW3]|uniref:hypothetical protein n=1 Tax=Streptomyces sp. JW3 TaxID=3456955 RepID=UPI003FA46DDF
MSLPASRLDRTASGTGRPPPELSCYTSSLLAHLELTRCVPEPGNRLAEAVRLAVRTDLPDGRLAFSQHDRIDRAGGRELAYRGTAEWDVARAALLAELADTGAVLAVGNTRHLPWAPQFGRRSVPHWLLLTDHHDGSWRVLDRFAALLPLGEQHPYDGRLDDDGLRAALTPPGALPRAMALRDAYALGSVVAVPPAGHYRWLVRQRTSGPAPAATGHWLTDPEHVMSFLADRFTDDAGIFADHADDLWAAARHQRYRLAARGATAASPAAAAAAAASWEKLPRALRIAVESAERGRPRPGVMRQALTDVAHAMAALGPKTPSTLQPTEERTA